MLFLSHVTSLSYTLTWLHVDSLSYTPQRPTDLDSHEGVAHIREEMHASRNARGRRFVYLQMVPMATPDSSPHEKRRAGDTRAAAGRDLVPGVGVGSEAG